MQNAMDLIRRMATSIAVSPQQNRPLRNAETDKWLELAQYQRDNPIFSQLNFDSSRSVPFNPTDNRSANQSYVYKPNSPEVQALMKILNRNRSGLPALLGFDLFPPKDYIRFDMQPHKWTGGEKADVKRGIEKANSILKQTMSKDINRLGSDFDIENYRRRLSVLIGLAQQRPDLAEMFTGFLGQLPRTPYTRD